MKQLGLKSIFETDFKKQKKEQNKAPKPKQNKTTEHKGENENMTEKTVVKPENEETKALRHKKKYVHLKTILSLMVNNVTD